MMLHYPVAAAIAFAVLVAVSLLHLFYKHKNITKPLLLPLIAVFYVLASFAPRGIVIAAMLASWVGDVLLIKDGTKWFTFGGCAFMLSHFLFSLAYCRDIAFNRPQIYFALLIVPVYLSVAAYIIHLIRDSAGKLTPALYLYLCFNAANNIFALLRLVSSPSLMTALTFCGTVLFFVSDCLLYIECFYGKQKFNPFAPVMATYILGETLIAIGMI